MTDLPVTSVLRLHRQDCALVATIDDPATRNALSDALLADLTTAFAFCRTDPGVRALVLRGDARVFCAGADLKGAIGGTGEAKRQAVVAVSLRGAAVYAALNALPLPVIAVVEGAAMGGGLGLAACADIVLATPGARFALSEVRLGVVPAQIAPFVVERIGQAAMRRLALTGSRFDATEALRIGLIDEIAADAEAVDARLGRLIADIRLCAPSAVAVTKAMIGDLSRLSDSKFAPRAADIFADAVLGEGAEGVAAFTAKRPPAWAGA